MNLDHNAVSKMEPVGICVCSELWTNEIKSSRNGVGYTLTNLRNPLLSPSCDLA